MPPREFAYDDESRATAGVRWPRWARDFETYLLAIGAQEDSQRKAILLHTIGDAAREVYYAIAQDPDKDGYQATKMALSNHFEPLKNTALEVHRFERLVQGPDETISDYVVRLRAAAARCGFEDPKNEIKRRLISGCRSSELMRALIKGDLELEKILEDARADEAIAR